eukprot:2081271-Rhodomonas_salina.1
MHGTVTLVGLIARGRGVIDANALRVDSRHGGGGGEVIGGGAGADRPDVEEEELVAMVIEWVRMVGAQCPGACMVLICTHAKSKTAQPENGTVQEVASRVKAKVSAEVQTLNKEIKEEVVRLKEHQADVQKKQEEQKQRKAQKEKPRKENQADEQAAAGGRHAVAEEAEREPVSYTHLRAHETEADL